jgi:hypothetical protein
VQRREGGGQLRARRHSREPGQPVRRHHRRLRRSGGPGESHPRTPTERNVTISRHSALLT